MKLLSNLRYVFGIALCSTLLMTCETINKLPPIKDKNNLNIIKSIFLHEPEYGLILAALIDNPKIVNAYDKYNVPTMEKSGKNAHFFYYVSITKSIDDLIKEIIFRRYYVDDKGKEDLLWDKKYKMEYEQSTIRAIQYFLGGKLASDVHFIYKEMEVDLVSYYTDFINTDRFLINKDNKIDSVIWEKRYLNDGRLESKNMKVFNIRYGKFEHEIVDSFGSECRFQETIVDWDDNGRLKFAIINSTDSIVDVLEANIYCNIIEFVY